MTKEEKHLDDKSDKSLEEEYKDYVKNDSVYSKLVNGIVGLGIARHFAEWGAEHLRDSTKKIDKSLEEAAEISFDEADALAKDYVNFLAKGLTENKPRPIGPHWFSEYAKKRFIAGAEWQKSRMLKDAFMDNDVVHDGRIELEGDPLPSLDPILLLPYPRFKPGDKVNVIVLKDNEDESK